MPRIKRASHTESRCSVLVKVGPLAGWDKNCSGDDHGDATVVCDHDEGAAAEFDLWEWTVRFDRRHRTWIHFASDGVLLAVSDAETAAIGGDKVRTSEWLVENGFPTVRQTRAAAAGSAGLTWPVFAKPRFGSASVGLMKLQHPDELASLADVFKKW